MYNKAERDAYDAVLKATTKRANNSDIAMSRSWAPALGWAPAVPANHFK
jgi:hypothetical protein